MIELVEFLAELSAQGIAEWLGWRTGRAIKNVQREMRLGLRLVLNSDGRLSDIVLLEGIHANKKISELPLDIVVSLQRTWPRFTGRGAIAHWLDRQAKGWRRSRTKTGPTFISTPPAR